MARDCPADAAALAEIAVAAVALVETLDELVALVASQVLAAASVSIHDGSAAQFGFAAAPDESASACCSAPLRGDSHSEPAGSRCPDARPWWDASRVQVVHDLPDENPAVVPRAPYDRR